MPGRYSGECQQRCNNADLLLRILTAEEATAKPPMVALLEGAVFHLYTAYLMHLRDIADSYSCTTPDLVVSLSELIERLAVQGMEPAESLEIKTLLSDKSSWLSCCLSAYDRCLGSRLLAETKSQDMQVSNAGIDLHQDHGDLQALTVADVTSWHTAMLELSTRHRTLMSEY